MQDTATKLSDSQAPTIARRATDLSLIKSITPRGGQAVEVGSVTAIVGPNNSGKTETLRDILRLTANFDPLAVDRSSEEGPRPVVLSDLNFVPKLSLERMLHGLTVLDADSSEGTLVQGVGPDLKTPQQRAIGRELQNILYRPIMNAKSVWSSSLGDLMRLRVSYIGPGDYKRLVAPDTRRESTAGSRELVANPALCRCEPSPGAERRICSRFRRGADQARRERAHQPVTACRATVSGDAD